MFSTTHQSDPLNRARLRWRARRGMLENDLVITRFLDKYETDLSDAQVGALTQLLELSDNDLFDLLMARKEPEPALQTSEMIDLLQQMRDV